MDRVIGRKNRAVKVAAACALSAAALFSFGGVSHAATSASTDVTLTIQNGDLTLSGIPASATLTASKLSGGAFVPASAEAGTAAFTDARGTGSGYHITAEGTPLKAANGGTTNTLPAGSLALDKAPSVQKVDTTSGNVPAVKVSDGAALDQGSVKLVSAPTDYTNGTGMGSYKVNLNNLKLPQLPASTYAGTYTTTITYSLATAP